MLQQERIALTETQQMEWLRLQQDELTVHRENFDTVAVTAGLLAGLIYTASADMPPEPATMPVWLKYVYYISSSLGMVLLMYCIMCATICITLGPDMLINGANRRGRAAGIEVRCVVQRATGAMRLAKGSVYGTFFAGVVIILFTTALCTVFKLGDFGSFEPDGKEPGPQSGPGVTRSVVEGSSDNAPVDASAAEAVVPLPNLVGVSFMHGEGLGRMEHNDIIAVVVVAVYGIGIVHIVSSGFRLKHIFTSTPHALFRARRRAPDAACASCGSTLDQGMDHRARRFWLPHWVPDLPCARGGFECYRCMGQRERPTEYESGSDNDGAAPRPPRAESPEFRTPADSPRRPARPPPGGAAAAARGPASDAGSYLIVDQPKNPLAEDGRYPVGGTYAVDRRGPRS